MRRNSARLRKRSSACQPPAFWTRAFASASPKSPATIGEFICELVDAFVTGGEDTLLEIAAAAHRNELRRSARAAHKLKGASANLHINDSAALAQELEAGAKAGQRTSGRRRSRRIAAEFERVAAAMKAAYGEGEQRKAS